MAKLRVLYMYLHLEILQVIKKVIKNYPSFNVLLFNMNGDFIDNIDHANLKICPENFC